MGLGKIICLSLLLALLLISSALAAPRFLDNGDQTVTDTQTGLMWTKNGNPAGTDLAYQDARDFVTSMNSAHALGHQDWRVPNIDELWSLVDHTRSYPALPAGNPFTGVVSSYYWSSTAVDDPYSPINREVDFGGGNLSSNHTWNNDMLWPVRGVMAGTSGDISLPAGTTGSSYSQVLPATWGMAPYTWSLLSGALPAGLRLDPGTGALAGTLGSSGVFTFTVQVTDSVGVKGGLSLALTVTDVPCGSAPVRIFGTTPVSYPDLPDAYAMAADNDLIQMQGLDFAGDLLMSRDLRLSLQGGYNCGYSANAGSSGMLGALRVSGGTVKIAGLRFK